jgi:hypothetical protein
MSNPEFKRNLWLSFSMHRLIAMPALLALTFLATALAGQQNEVANNLYMASIALFVFIVWLWGARNANATIVDELRDKTWDQQRMSALEPWTMTWGKLIGSTSFNWYGGLMCLPVIAASGIAIGKPDVLCTLLTLCAVGVMLHAALIALNLHTSQFEARIIQRGGMGWLAIILVFIFIPSFTRSSSNYVSWWGIEVDRMFFWLDSALLFAACATFAAWRVICNALQVRTLPWAWPAFACVLAIYFAGFMHDNERMSPLLQLLLTGLFVSGAMSYASLFSEPHTLLLWRRLRLLQEKQDRRGWLEHLPLWTTTLTLAFLFALLILLTSGGEHLNYLRPPHALAFALMVLRDACILLLFSFSPNSKRANGATVLYLIVLDLLLPFLAGVAGLDAARYFFLPFEAGHAPWSSTLIMTIHAAIAMALVSWRLRNK